VDWTQAAADLRAHAQRHVDHMTTVTGHPHRMDPAYYRLAAQCDAAAYSPTVAKPKLEAVVRAAFGATPVAVRFGGNFDLSAGTGV